MINIKEKFTLAELFIHYNWLKRELKEQIFLIDVFGEPDDDNLDEELRIRFYNNAAEDLKKVVVEMYKTLKIFNKKINKI